MEKLFCNQFEDVNNCGQEVWEVNILLKLEAFSGFGSPVFES